MEVIRGSVPELVGYGSSSSYGYGSGYGYGDGYGSGDGFGDGSGYGYGDGYGDGAAGGDGNGNGDVIAHAVSAVNRIADANRALVWAVADHERRAAAAAHEEQAIAADFPAPLCDTCEHRDIYDLPSEFAWVIVDSRSKSGEPKYWTGYKDLEAWSLDDRCAVRFARKRDAEVVASVGLYHGWHLIAKVEKHGWMHDAPPLAPLTAQETR